jgi:hypothetical protein
MALKISDKQSLVCNGSITKLFVLTMPVTKIVREIKNFFVELVVSH